jgi:hypothetical protein
MGIRFCQKSGVGVALEVGAFVGILHGVQGTFVLILTVACAGCAVAVGVLFWNVGGRDCKVEVDAKLAG